MPASKKRGWILAIAAVFGAIAIGLAVALLVAPVDQPKPVAPPATATIKIAPTPQVEAAAPIPPATTPASPHIVRPRHTVSRPRPTTAPDFDTGTVVTTNSW